MKYARPSSDLFFSHLAGRVDVYSGGAGFGTGAGGGLDDVVKSRV
jgi:hypothetical protein